MIPVFGMLRKLFLFFLIFLNLHIYLANTSLKPSSPKASFLNNGKYVLGAAGLSALAIGKRIYDGPEFLDAVDLTGKTIVITGANTGLGKEASIKIASLGKPELFLLCRDMKKAKIAMDEIVAKSGNTKIRLIECDLSDLKSISRAAAELKKSVAKIDVLQLNSGVMAIPTREVTKDGFEKHMGVNHLGHFKLAQEVFPLLKNTKDARVVTVSSSAHLLGKIDRSNLQLDREDSYGPWLAYGNSKLANILFTRELNRRLQETGNPSGIISVTLHPGACRTELGRYIFDQDSVPKALYPVLGVIAAPAVYFTKDAYMGAQTQIFLSASKSISVKNGGSFFDNSRPADTSSEAKDADEAKWLWEVSEKLTGSKFDV